MANILYLAPLKVSDPSRVGSSLEGTVRPETTLTGLGFTRGPHHLEYHYYETVVLQDLLHTVVEAERDGYDAMVIGCFYDLGLQEARELSERMVVTAPCESSVLLAGSLGHTFSVIVGRRKWIPQMHDNVRRYGMDERLASFRYIDLWVPQYHEDEAETARRFFEVGRKAIDEDAAEVLILGCTASAGFYEELQREFEVPVIDSAIAAVKHAEHLVDLRDRFGWSHSKIGGWESPPRSELDGWDLHGQYQASRVREIWTDLAVYPAQVVR